MDSNGVNWEKLCPQILIYLSNRIKYNAPKHFEMLRGKTSKWVSVFISPVLFSNPSAQRTH